MKIDAINLIKDTAAFIAAHIGWHFLFIPLTMVRSYKSFPLQSSACFLCVSPLQPALSGCHVSILNIISTKKIKI